MKSAFAIFDIDHTIIKGDSMFLMLLFGIKKKPILLLYTPIIFIKIALYFFKIIDAKKAKESIYIPLKFLNTTELEEFYCTVLAKKIYPKMLDIIKTHKDQGCHILLVSSSPELYLKFFKKIPHIDEIIGTKLVKIEKKYINKIYEKNCKGDEKVRRINQYLKVNNLEIDFDNSYAYSDSLVDKPMLSLAKNKFKINKKDGSICKLLW